jgi:hypothetical protein
MIFGVSYLEAISRSFLFLYIIALFSLFFVTRKQASRLRPRYSVQLRSRFGDALRVAMFSEDPRKHVATLRAVALISLILSILAAVGQMMLHAGASGA